MKSACHPHFALRSARYKAVEGEHPHFVNPNLFVMSNELNRKEIKDFKALELPVDHFGSGHTIYEITEPDGRTQHIPLTPLLVKDLAGRVIFTGAKREEKTDEDWPQDQQRLRFPKGCQDITATTLGAREVEHIFLTETRTLMPEHMAAYDEADFPYKERLDTFYADGWRLPQTEMLYVRTMPDAEKQRMADVLGKKLLEAWAEKAPNSTYTKFYEKLGGESYFEELFLQGCTLIPTIEGCNGFNKVNEKFELEDFWAGRAVQGLHDVKEERDDTAPAGTILEVLRPGFLTATQIVPAQVAISNGKGFQPSFAAKPAMLPNLQFPHPRCSAVWGDVWLPTSPGHFEAPALWGWDADTGRFIQKTGPLWDPVHYVYGSTSRIFKALKHAKEGQGVPVPEEMKQRFYPLSPLHLQDVWEKEGEAEVLKKRKDGKPAASVGYHPLPLAAEIEVDPYVFPECAPVARGVQAPMADVMKRMVPIIKPAGEGGEKTPPQRYPFLERYRLHSEPNITEEMLQYVPMALPHVAEKDLTRHIRRAMGGVKKRKTLDALHPTLFDMLKEFREQALWWRRLRYRLRDKYPENYKRGFWLIEEPEITEKTLRYQNVGRKPLPKTEKAHEKEEKTPSADGESIAAQGGIR